MIDKESNNPVVAYFEIKRLLSRLTPISARTISLFKKFNFTFKISKIFNVSPGFTHNGASMTNEPLKKNKNSLSFFFEFLQNYSLLCQNDKRQLLKKYSK